MRHAIDRRAVLVGFGAGLLSGCFSTIETEFPPGLEPLEDLRVPVPPSTQEFLYTVHGQTDDHTWVHGRSYIHAPPGRVWAAAKDAELMANVCGVDEYAIEYDVEEGYEHSFQLSYVVRALVTVRWDEHWRYGTVEGRPANPERAMIRYQKVVGSDAIEFLQGSVQVLATSEPEVTELQFVEHLRAAGGGVSDMLKAMLHRHESLRAAAQGRSRPACT